MQDKTKLLELLQARIDKLQTQIDDATDPEVVDKRTNQRDRLLEKKAFVEGS